MIYSPLLLAVIVPVLAGILCLFIPDRFKFLSRAVAFGVAASAFAASIFIFINKPLSWQYGPARTLVADNLSSFIGLGISLFALLVIVYSFGFIGKSHGRYFGYYLVTLGSALAVVFANDFITLLIGWGLIAVTLFLLVNLQETAEAGKSSKKALIIIGGTDALMLFGVTLVWAASKTFYMDDVHLELSSAWNLVAYISIMIAALAKAGAMPFHSWLPDVAEASAIPVTAYLPASLDKLLGIYLLMRLSLSLFVMNNISNTILLFVGSFTIVLAVAFALVQHDLKKLLGYHAVSQVGYMVLGIGTGNAIGIAGGLFHMLNNAVYKSCLFLCGGSVEKRRGTTDLASLGGLAKFMPITFGAFLVASLSISGIPPFNGFFSKWMIYQGIIKLASPKNPLWILWLVSAMFGSALTLASFMKLLHAVFLGRRQEGTGTVKEVGFSMWIPVTILALLCLIFGVFAFQIPIPLFIMPAVGASSYIGLWQPVVATILIIVGLSAGAIIYFLFKPGKFRTVGSFVGGEDPGKLVRISGTEFYDTIRDLKGVGALYRQEESGSLDIYYLSRRIIYSFTEILQRLHNGILPTYLVWCLLGMLAMFLAVFLR